jgi:NAD(P)-dependent dehydrogenase (short-subunit alcohol dehydrogenase family)
MPTILITGANRGLGLEFARQYAVDGWEVLACCREPRQAMELQALADQHPALAIKTLDVTDHSEIDSLAQNLSDHPIDLLLNNAGIVGPVPVPQHIQRQHFGTLDYALWDTVLRTNTFGPVKITEAFLPNVLIGEQKKIITLSSTIGSIAERDTPAMAYATSKAALNKAMTLLASQLREQEIIVALLCPGYVKTRMDFGTADLDAEQSVTAMRRLIDHMSLTDSGSFTRYNGERVAW